LHLLVTEPNVFDKIFLLFWLWFLALGIFALVTSQLHLFKAD
jgi:hypothetical protein